MTSLVMPMKWKLDIRILLTFLFLYRGVTRNTADLLLKYLIFY